MSPHFAFSAEASIVLILRLVMTLGLLSKDGNGPETLISIGKVHQFGQACWLSLSLIGHLTLAFSRKWDCFSQRK